MNPVKFIPKPGSSRDEKRLARHLNEWGQLATQIQQVVQPDGPIDRMKLKTETLIRLDDDLKRQAPSMRTVGGNVAAAVLKTTLKRNCAKARKLSARYTAALSQVVDDLITVLNGPDAAECLWIANVFLPTLPDALARKLKQSCPSISWS